MSPDDFLYERKKNKNNNNKLFVSSLPQRMVHRFSILSPPNLYSLKWQPDFSKTSLIEQIASSICLHQPNSRAKHACIQVDYAFPITSSSLLALMKSPSLLILVHVTWEGSPQRAEAEDLLQVQTNCHSYMHAQADVLHSASHFAHFFTAFFLNLMILWKVPFLA